MFFFGCTNGNYKLRAVNYLKTKLANPTSIDTIKFIKPDSIYTTFYDTPDYKALRRGINRFLVSGDSAEVAKLNLVIAERMKTYKKVLVGWDVRLIYKAKDKNGALKKDTCRFTFDSKLASVIDLNGVSL